jgi:hypothetical protein
MLLDIVQWLIVICAAIGALWILHHVWRGVKWVKSVFRGVE